MVSAWPGRSWPAGIPSSAAPPHHHAAALQFPDVFEPGTQSSTRHRRLRYLLLFSLRSLLLLLLVFAFANPFIRSASGGTESKLMLVVIDQSFSMRAGTKFAEAKQGALELLASRPASQPAEVMALGGRLAVLTQPVQDAGALQSAVASVQPTDSRANLGELAQGVRVLSETVKTPIELHLFSDMQKTALPANFTDMALPGNVSVVLHKSGGSVATPNWTVESVNAPAQLADPKDSRLSRVEAVIAGYGTTAATKNVSLGVNGKTLATRRVEVPAGGRGTVSFQPLDVPYGMNRCVVKIEDAHDSFPADDAHVFSVKRSDPERVLFIHRSADTRSALYFGAAMAATDQALFTLQSIESEKSSDIDPAKYAFVVLSDTVTLPSLFENALARYVQSGGNVLIAAGTAAAHRARIPIFGGYASEGRVYTHGDYGTVGATDLTHPAMRDAHGWSELKIYFVASVDGAQSRVIARLADQTPLLIDKQIGEGHVVFFASGFDNLTNDLPIHAAFVPFIDRAARYLAGQNDAGGSQLIDSSISLRSAAASTNTASAGAEVIGPDGKRALSLEEAATAPSIQLTKAGFYQIRRASGRTALIGVNADPRESNLEPVADDLLQLWGAHGGPVPVAAAALMPAKKSEQSLWWYVMLLVLMAGIAESIVASRYLGTQREEA